MGPRFTFKNHSQHPGPGICSQLHNPAARSSSLAIDVIIFWKPCNFEQSHQGTVVVSYELQTRPLRSTPLETAARLGGPGLVSAVSTFDPRARPAFIVRCASRRRQESGIGLVFPFLPKQDQSTRRVERLLRPGTAV